MLGSLIDLDTEDDILVLEGLYQQLTVGGILVVERLFEEDDTADVLFEPLGVEEETTILNTILMRVAHFDLIETRTNRAGGLIGSKNTLTRTGNLTSSLDQFSLELTEKKRDRQRAEQRPKETVSAHSSSGVCSPPRPICCLMHCVAAVAAAVVC